MKTRICLVVLGLLAASSVWSAGGINYDGTTLELNNDFTRTECGTMAKKTMAETSGLAASRTTSGYLWAHGDENLDENRKLVAVTPEGKLTMTLNISTSGSDRDDWEDIATGRYEGKNYIFIGAIGDNDLQFKDKYDIFFFEEPSIAEETRTVQAKYIRFGYPDGKAHNTETLMYDNIEQMFYIADKIDGGVCHLYKLPFRTDYGTAVQTLTEVCALGNGSVFDLCTGGDITPDGKWMAIKNKQYILLWERQGSESLSETAKRRPQQIAAYKEEKQGESLAWSDATTFYTTSDQKKDMPIYKYTRKADSSVANVTEITIDGHPLSGFKSDWYSYDVELAYGTSDVPVVAAQASDEGVITVTQAESLPGTATVLCKSKDGTNSVTYTIAFTIAATPSTDATLKALMVNGGLIKGFAPNQLTYVDTIAYIDALPVLTAETNDSHATLQIHNVTEVTKAGNDATVVVTAQDGITKKTYTVTFHRADAIKKINEVILSNNYSAYIPEKEQSMIRGWYLAGEAAPTIKSYKLSEGTSWQQEGNSVTITGADGSQAVYTLDIHPVEPVAFSDKEIVCDGSEGAWIKSAYGWDSSKKWRFSKTDNDYSREIAGKTHVELFLPACDTVVLTSMNTERDVRIAINGVPLGDKVKLVKAGLSLAVNRSEPFMLTVSSAQSSGDGGIAAVRMIRKTPQGIEETQSNEKTLTTKFLYNGQLLILRGGHTYNTSGQLLQVTFTPN